MSCVAQNTGVAHNKTQKGHWPPTGSPGWLSGVVCLLHKEQKSKNNILLTACDVAQTDVLRKVATRCTEVPVFLQGRAVLLLTLKKVVVLEGCIFILIEVKTEI